jgi:conserved oligomeric Golgi complex subunit 4
VDSKELNSIIKSSSEMAKGVSSKVQKLHLIQTRVHSALNNVQGQIGLKSCLEGVESAIKSYNYEEATKLISSVLNLDDQIEVDNKNAQLLKQSETEVKNMILKKFSESLKNETEKERFAGFFILTLKTLGLFLPLKIEKEGLNILLKDVKFELEEELKEIYFDEEKNQHVDKIDFSKDSIVELMKYIIDCTAFHMETNEPFIVKFFGFSQIDFFLTELLNIFDQVALRTFQDYETFYSLKTLKKKLNSESSKKIDFILEELMQVFQIFENFQKFISNFKKNFKRVSEFSKKIQEFSSIFIELDYYYSVFCVNKAVELDTFDEEDEEDDDDEEKPEHVCSSMVSDSFYIFKQNLERNVQTQNVDIIKGGIKNTTTILMEQLKIVFKILILIIRKSQIQPFHHKDPTKKLYFFKLNNFLDWFEQHGIRLRIYHSLEDPI